MKKTMLQLLCCFVILCTAVAYADDCPHVWCEAAGTPIVRIEMNNNTSHMYVTYVCYSCVRCGKEEWRASELISPRYENHSMGYVKDLGHSEGRLVHNYLYRCSKCGYEEIHEELCFGPPCTTHIEKVPEEDDVSEE